MTASVEGNDEVVETPEEHRARPGRKLLLEELALHERICAGDEAAVLEGLERFGHLVYCSLLGITGDRGVAEDLTERAFVALWRSPESFDPRQGPIALQLLREVSSSLTGVTGGDAPDRGDDVRPPGLTTRAA